MEMTIEKSSAPTPMSNEEIVDTLKTMVFGVQAFERFNAKERETLDKAWNIIDQYETRLKADMVAMLTDLQLEIEEKPMYYDPLDISDLIQQKINVLKGDRTK